MNIPHAHPSLSAALLLLVPLLPAYGHAQAPSGEGVAAGRIVEASTSRGINGAFLRAFDLDGRIVGRGFSGQDGFFTVVLPSGGPYRLEVESMGFRVAIADSLRVSPPDTLRMSPIELVPDSARSAPAPGTDRLMDLGP